jgi:hypothetical protein
MTNNQIETASRDSAELSLDDLMQVTGGGAIADGVGYFVGNVIGGAFYIAEKIGKLLK